MCTGTEFLKVVHEEVVAADDAIRQVAVLAQLVVAGADPLRELDLGARERHLPRILLPVEEEAPLGAAAARRIEVVQDGRARHVHRRVEDLEALRLPVEDIGTAGSQGRGGGWGAGDGRCGP